MIYALGDVSGAHFNPAVTVAILVAGVDEKLTGQKAGAFIPAQLVGGLVGAFLSAKISHANDFGPVKDHTWGQVGAAEAVFTFVLCLVVLCVACSKSGNPEMFGLAIGSCVTVGGFAIGGIS